MEGKFLWTSSEHPLALTFYSISRNTCTCLGWDSLWFRFQMKLPFESILFELSDCRVISKFVFKPISFSLISIVKNGEFLAETVFHLFSFSKAISLNVVKQQINWPKKLWMPKSKVIMSVLAMRIGQKKHLVRCIRFIAGILLFPVHFSIDIVYFNIE